MIIVAIGEIVILAKPFDSCASRGLDQLGNGGDGTDDLEDKRPVGGDFRGRILQIGAAEDTRDAVLDTLELMIVSLRLVGRGDRLSCRSMSDAGSGIMPLSS